MRLNKQAIELLRAEKCLSASKLISNAKISKSTFYKACIQDVDAAIIGKIARALNVPVSSIIIQEETENQEAIS